MEERNYFMELLTGYLEQLRKQIPSMIVGSAAYGSTIFISTWAQKRLHISTGTGKFIPSTAGFLTVCAASLLSHRACNEVTTSHYDRKQQRGLRFPWLANPMKEQNPTFSISHKKKTYEVTIPFTTQQIAVCIAGVLAFKAMGGTFRSIAPSSYTTRGSFARQCIPAKSTAYATSNERDVIQKIGKKYGCHTCGTRRPFYGAADGFVADHIPPNAVVEIKPQQQDFYPQCKTCSGIQGGLLSSAKGGSSKQLMSVGGGKNSFFHGFRISKTWYPLREVYV